jgi:hypothetical protein
MKELNFHNNNHRDFSVKEGDKLVKRLAGHIGLRKLDLSLLRIGREGWTTIITSSESTIQTYFILIFTKLTLKGQGLYHLGLMGTMFSENSNSRTF